MGYGFILDDGQFYTFDIQIYSYNACSDHFDIDHYDYYKGFMHQYQYGYERVEQNFVKEIERINYSVGADTGSFVNNNFSILVKTLNNVEFIKVLRSINAKVEDLHKFHDKFDWSEVIKELDNELESFFTAKIIFDCCDFEQLKNLLNEVP